MVLGSLEIGFKYSGQPVTYHRCQFTEHVVKNCPKGCQPPLPPPSAESDPSGDGMDTSTPSLFTQPTKESYAAAASESSERSTARETDEELRALAKKMRHEEDLRASRGRKQEIPSPSGSDDEQGAPSKKSMASGISPDDEDNNESSEHKENNDSSDPAAPTEQVPATPSSAGLYHFIATLTSTGWQRSALMQAIPSEGYYN